MTIDTKEIANKFQVFALCRYEHHTQVFNQLKICCKEIDSLTAENERLRKALEKILRLETVEFKENAYNPNSWLTVNQLIEDVARKALKGEERE